MSVATKYFYIFRSSDGKTCKVLRGDGPPKPTDGFGGWTVVNRPRRIGLTQWDGRNPYGMDVPILFDNRDGCETDISKLFQMSVGYDYQPPPTVTIDGAVPIKGAKWVINGIDWGDDVQWVQTGNQKPYRTRQDATVHLLEYKPEVRVKILSTKVLPNVYTVHNNNETMRSIAKVMYGDGSQWTRIKAANPSIRDPNHIKKGTKVRIP